MKLFFSHFPNLIAAIFCIFSVSALGSDFPEGTWTRTVDTDELSVQHTIHFDGHTKVSWALKSWQPKVSDGRTTEDTETGNYDRSYTTVDSGSSAGRKEKRVSYSGTVKVSDVTVGGEKKNILRITLVRNCKEDSIFGGVTVYYYYLDSQKRLWILTKEEANKSDEIIAWLINEHQDRVHLDFKGSF